ncbi:MAG: hypothetical protein OQL06_09145 [Gammaproteobacteria bacterium]|nr:hypothetical protein [Gammaproteobacteria bacterium]
MNILTIGIKNSISDLFNLLFIESQAHNIQHTDKKDEALEIIKSTERFWDWIIIQGHDDPEHWKSILCAVNANAENTPITVLSSHIDGTRMRTPVCSMHNNGNGMSISRCAMQSLLEDESPPLKVAPKKTTSPTPIVFEYHAPCR